MLTYNDLRVGVLFLYESEPYEVIDFEFLRMQQRKPVAQTRIKNLINGKILERNFHQNETFEEVEIEKKQAKFLYSNKGEFWFCDPKNPAARFKLSEEIIGKGGGFLKPNTIIETKLWNERVISLDLPIKMELKVTEAPPSIKGNTAQGGTKAVTLETGAIVNAPLFVNTGDIVRVNTQTGEYVERVEKSKE